MAEQKVAIKKYGDRRLYDTDARRYVNIDDIARMIREGKEIEVLDVRTGKDITRMILTQIIMDDIRDGESGLPLKLLHQLVVTSDRAGHEILSWYLENASELSKKAGGVLRSGVSEAKSAVTAPMEYVRNLLGTAPPPPDQDAAELAALRREVLELKELLAERGPTAPAPKSKPAAAAPPRRGRSAPKPKH